MTNTELRLAKDGRIHRWLYGVFEFAEARNICQLIRQLVYSVLQALILGPIMFVVFAMEWLVGSSDLYPGASPDWYFKIKGQRILPIAFILPAAIAINTWLHCHYPLMPVWADVTGFLCLSFAVILSIAFLVVNRQPIWNGILAGCHFLRKKTQRKRPTTPRALSTIWEIIKAMKSKYLCPGIIWVEKEKE